MRQQDSWMLLSEVSILLQIMVNLCRQIEYGDQSAIESIQIWNIAVSAGAAKTSFVRSLYCVAPRYALTNSQMIWNTLETASIYGNLLNALKGGYFIYFMPDSLFVLQLHWPAFHVNVLLPGGMFTGNAQPIFRYSACVVSLEDAPKGTNLLSSFEGPHFAGLVDLKAVGLVRMLRKHSHTKVC